MKTKNIALTLSTIALLLVAAGCGSIEKPVVENTTAAPATSTNPPPINCATQGAQRGECEYGQGHHAPVATTPTPAPKESTQEIAEVKKQTEESNKVEANIKAEAAEEEGHEGEWQTPEGQELLTLMGEEAKAAGLNREQASCVKKHISESGSSIVEVLSKEKSEGAHDEEVKDDAKYCLEHS